MPHTAYADVARLTRLAQHFATEAVQAGDVAAFPPPAALAELPAVELRRLLDGLLTIRPPRPIDDEDMRDELDEMLAHESAERAASGASAEPAVSPEASEPVGCATGSDPPGPAEAWESPTPMTLAQSDAPPAAVVTAAA